ncbi:MAG TPA: enoyl-CoA hydratase/isomerase family protein [Paenalcaligenes sp.]|nr:enoyl-CoA hydratase/isomerase family protein [Paenalcaligenes sp.]
MTEKVLIARQPTQASGKYLGILTLNREKSLNSLDIDTVQALYQQLKHWQSDEDTVAVVIRGTSARAFCAGADLRALYDSMQAHEPGAAVWDNNYARGLFVQEYELDYLIHTYEKPIIAVGFGVLMGGGVGLFSGASHRLVNPQTRFAMPEVVIGLFPDVAGSWMFAHLPAGIAHTLAMTGAHINGADVYYLGLADYLFDDSVTADDIEQALMAADWHGCPYAAASAVLAPIHQEGLTKLGVLVPHYDYLRTLGTRPAFAELCQQFLDWGQEASRDDSALDPWLQRTGAQFVNACPMSVRLSYELLSFQRHHSLAQAFQTDFNIAMHCVASGDFQEGIRALLIDKDQQPRWRHTQPLAVTMDEVRAFLQPVQPQGQAHPLAHLGQERSS